MRSEFSQLLLDEDVDVGSIHAQGNQLCLDIKELLHVLRYSPKLLLIHHHGIVSQCTSQGEVFDGLCHEAPFSYHTLY